MAVLDTPKRLVWAARIAADDRRGLDFYRTCRPDDAGPEWPDLKQSSASAPRAVRRTLREAGVGTQDRILDVGCGKGAALRAMLRLSPQRLAGIELSPAIGEIARRNFAILGQGEVEIITADALRYDGYGGFNVLYAYNPLPVDRVPAMLAAIRRCHAPGRELTLIYANPVGHEAVAASGLFSTWRKVPGFAGNPVHIYRA